MPFRGGKSKDPRFLPLRCSGILYIMEEKYVEVIRWRDYPIPLRS